ncbi:hypothetical protein DFH08DRAFT_953728 [Mycena albidolilacea]|uniref:Uncharacterized protein n=1 Tax=Mycena albidolilacea TaxID=1033008 RepID=A0AAD7AHZ9_9AGAR|nr:hypothetical protein DFH08DRAFT_953728 [Mycena albidolilacea]
MRSFVLPGNSYIVIQVKEVVFDPVVLAATFNITRYDFSIIEASGCERLAATLVFIINNAAVTGMNVFMPTILAFNYPHASPIRIQLLSMSSNICAWALALTIVYLAMRYKKHAAAALPAALLPLLGTTRYACFPLTTMGGSYGSIVLAWAVSNAWTDSARALTGAMITGTGAIGSITSRVLDFQPTPEPDT